MWTTDNSDNEAGNCNWACIKLKCIFITPRCSSPLGTSGLWAESHTQVWGVGNQTIITLSTNLYLCMAWIIFADLDAARCVFIWFVSFSCFDFHQCFVYSGRLNVLESEKFIALWKSVIALVCYYIMIISLAWNGPQMTNITVYCYHIWGNLSSKRSSYRDGLMHCWFCSFHVICRLKKIIITSPALLLKFAFGYLVLTLRVACWVTTTSIIQFRLLLHALSTYPSSDAC